MPRLEHVRADHGPGLLDFEGENRRYFVASISDRGDDYFAEFDARHRALLAEQESGRHAFYVLVDDDGSILGRFNLSGIANGAAELGYRVAERVAGRGIATAAVRELCELAVTEHGLRVIRARAAHDNLASERVLLKNGFVPIGPAEVGTRTGVWYERVLPAGP